MPDVLDVYFLVLNVAHIIYHEHLWETVSSEEWTYATPLHLFTVANVADKVFPGL
jgi:hypothetical protein